MRESIGTVVGVLVSVLCAGSAALGQPARSFGPDSQSTGIFTGAGTTQPGLSCGQPSPFVKCSGFLASGLDGTLLDVTVTVPPVAAPRPLVVFVHGYGGSKTSSSSYDDALASRGYTVLRHSTRGFGDSWGLVNLSDIDVEVADVRSLIGQVADDARFGVNADAVAIAGASYGGGHSWLAAAKPSFTSPGGKAVRIRTVVPIAAWSDLLASLRPNGKQWDSIDPPGFFKLSFLEGLFLGGLRRSLSRPYPNYPDFLWLWNGYALVTEPNNLPPVGTSLVNGLAGYRSIFWQGEFWRSVRAGTGIPILLVQGFTDDLFPLTEALRMYEAIRAIDPQYPIAAYFGDIGHPRAANKPDEVNYALNLVFQWLDDHLLGAGAAPAGVAAAITRPLSSPFNPADVVRVASYDALATGTARAALPGEAVLTFNPANVSGLFVDPFVFSGCDALSAGTCSAPPPDVVPGDVAVYTMPAATLAASAGRAPGSFLIAGQPQIKLTATTAAPRVELNARLFDVKPDGSRHLVTRGTVTLDSGSPFAPIGATGVSLTTYGNLWEIGAADQVQLELTNVDSPYLTPSRIPSVTVLGDVEVRVPVR